MKNINKAVAGTALALMLVQASYVQAGAFSFQEPVGWTVGDAESTFQEWESTVTGFSLTGTTPTASNVNPAISSTSTMGVSSPGFVAGSGGYYSFSESTTTYGVSADVFNHGGASGSGGPYTSNYGTRVFVQTAATIGQAGVLGPEGVGLVIDSLELVQINGSPITGGDNASKLQSNVLALNSIITSFGPADQEEILFEFWLPGYTDDFRVQFESSRHSSFQHLRIDTLIEAAASVPDDLNNDGFIDGLDLGILLGSWGTTTTQEFGELNGTPPVDGLDLGILLGAWNPPPQSAMNVPEPQSLLLALILGFTGLVRRTESWIR